MTDGDQIDRHASPNVILRIKTNIWWRMAIKQIMRIDRHPSPDVTLRIKTNIRWQMAINSIAIRHRMLVYKIQLLLNIVHVYETLNQ